MKNIQPVPQLIQDNAQKIFELGSNCLLSGFGTLNSLQMPGTVEVNEPLNAFLNQASSPQLYWSYDLGGLARAIQAVVTKEEGIEVPLVQRAA